MKVWQSRIESFVYQRRTWPGYLKGGVFIINCPLHYFSQKWRGWEGSLPSSFFSTKVSSTKRRSFRDTNKARHQCILLNDVVWEWRHWIQKGNGISRTMSRGHSVDGCCPGNWEDLGGQLPCPGGLWPLTHLWDRVGETISSLFYPCFIPRFYWKATEAGWIRLGETDRPFISCPPNRLEANSLGVKAAASSLQGTSVRTRGVGGLAPPT